MKTVEQVEIEYLTAELGKQEAEIKALRDRIGKIEAAIGWVIAAATGIGAIVVALRSGLIKWLAGVEG